MSLLGHSLLDVQNLSESEVLSIFQTAKRIRHLHQTKKLDFAELLKSNASRYVGMIFFEPSTRTRASFEVAAYKLGLQVLCPEFGGSSSRSKGETLADTFLTIAAMDPDVMVVRYGECEELDAELERSEIPVINAGSGTQAHPTQALLDSFTIFEELGEVRGKRVYIVGDIVHSRVAQSNIKLLKNLGAEIAVGGPARFLEGVDDTIPKMELDEGLEWANVVMALRIQLERHDKNAGFLTDREASEKGDLDAPLTPESYHSKYGLNPQRLKKLSDGIILHPGPMNHGVEIDVSVLKDPRCRVHKQVQNGVYTRAAVLSQILGIKV